jgi:hypothetical protein
LKWQHNSHNLSILPLNEGKDESSVQFNSDKIQKMSDQLPENRYINRLSIILATLATFLAALFLIPRDPIDPGTNLFGFILNFSMVGLIPLVMMVLCTGGCFWLFMTHPDRETFLKSPWVLTPNVVLPSLATLIISIMLTQLERNQSWWFALGFGLVIIGVILNAEYRVLAPGGEAYKFVAPLLISLAFGLFLALTISLAASQLRLYVQAALILISAGFVAFRTIHLRTKGKGAFSRVFFCGLLCAEIAGAMYYLFLKPVQYGLIVCGMLYLLTSLVVIEGPLTRRKLIEPLVMAGLLVIFFVVVSLS